jgi:hypothetical protein
MTGFLIFLASIGLGLGALAVWLVMAAGRMEEHWPDDAPTLNVQNGIGDSRPLR